MPASMQRFYRAQTAQQLWREGNRDARWTVKSSKAKVDENGDVQQRDIVVPHFGSGARTSPMPPPMTAPGCAGD